MIDSSLNNQDATYICQNPAFLLSIRSMTSQRIIKKTHAKRLNAQSVTREKLRVTEKKIRSFYQSRFAKTMALIRNLYRLSSIESNRQLPPAEFDVFVVF